MSAQFVPPASSHRPLRTTPSLFYLNQLTRNKTSWLLKLSGRAPAFWCYFTEATQCSLQAFGQQTSMKAPRSPCPQCRQCIISRGGLGRSVVDCSMRRPIMGHRCCALTAPEPVLGNAGARPADCIAYRTTPCNALLVKWLICTHCDGGWHM
jgi:hypothetical protein